MHSTMVPHPANTHAAVVWVDGWHALVARSDAGQRTITEVDREADAELEYLHNIARATHDCERLMILGPDPARLAFEREYVALYQRPDRLIETEAAAPTTERDLLGRLRFLDGSGGEPIG